MEILLDILMNNEADVIAWIGNVNFLLGSIALARGNIRGWFANLAGNVAYLYQAMILVNVPLLFLSATLGLVNIYGIYNWRKKKMSTIGE